MDFASFFQHIFLVFASCLGVLGLPLPLPLPPLPEDPALLRVAPADSCLFVQWFGTAQPAETPTNRSERLAAEPEVRALIDCLVRATRDALDQDSRGQAPAMLELFDHGIAAMQQPGCLFVVGTAPFGAGFVARRGDDAAAMATAITTTIAQIDEDTRPTTREIGGVDFEIVPLPGEMQFVGWAAIDGYFALALGEPAANQIVAGLRDQNAGLAGHPALVRLRPGCKVERPVLRTYAAVDRLAEQLGFARRFWGPLGFDQATAALAESGLEGEDFVSRLQIVLPKAEGVLGQLRGRPLSQDDLGLIPDDATVALALRAKDGSFESVLLQTMAAFSGQDLGQDWEQFLAQANQRLAVNFRDDLILHTEDCAVAWSSPNQGGLGFTAAVAAVPLSDGATFAAGLAALRKSLAAIAPNKAKARAGGNRLSPRGGYFEQFQHGDATVSWIDLIDRDFPFGFAWTSTDEHFLLGLLPQPLRSAIDASRLPNFDDALVRRPTMARRGPAVAMFYLDLQGLLRQAYGPLMMLFQVGSQDWQREGFDLDLADVPRLRSLAPHLGPELVLLETTKTGCKITRRGSLPVLDLLLVTCGMACLLQFD